MKCEEVHSFLDTYLDGELDLARQLELEQHLVLAHCASLSPRNVRNFEPSLPLAYPG